MAASSIGAQMGIIASPVSVAVVSLVAMLSSYTFNAAIWNSSTCSLSPYLLRCAAFLAIGIFSWFRGKARTKTRSSRNSSQCRKTIAMSMAMPPPTGSGAATQQLDRHVDFPRHHRTGGGAGAFSDLRPSFGGKPLSMVSGDPDVHADGRGIDRHHYPHQPGVYL